MLAHRAAPRNAHPGGFGCNDTGVPPARLAGTIARMRVALATSSTIAADGGRAVARQGGNAVDAAIAAALVSMNTEPGVCALAGGGYVTVWPPGTAPLTYDGYVTVPGAGASLRPADGRVETVGMAYGGGVTTLIGPGSVAVPGALAALDHAWSDHGSVPWGALLAPGVRAAAEGFPLPRACHYYLGYSGEAIFSLAADSRTALYRPDGRLREPGERIVVPHLARSLTRIAERGAAEFYTGEIGAAIADHVRGRGGTLTRDDLAGCCAVRRAALTVDVGDWQLATNPAPAIGGAVLVAMLERLRAFAGVDAAALLRVCREVLGYRRDRLDFSRDLDADVAELLARAQSGGLSRSAATVHTSAVDEHGLACAITMSSGYGSGEMAPGTGLWLNNCLGEIDLNRRGLEVGPPGTRLLSNMAPSAARSGDAMLAIGSPGASRITTALLQTLVNFIHHRMPLERAIDAPRLHVEYDGDDERIAYEAGVDAGALGNAHRYDERNMYFGGVGAALRDAAGDFAVAADNRREGGTFIA
ncbi:MAG: gamma-glutamyltransferase [Pseudomonadota bacterium]